MKNKKFWKDIDKTGKAKEKGRVWVIDPRRSPEELELWKKKRLSMEGTYVMTTEDEKEMKKICKRDRIAEAR